MENLILTLVFIGLLCGVFAVGAFVEEVIRTRREKKFHQRVMSKVLF
ncbi:hypothetical protein UFOVP26_53 [uncultured Caudovirales phage]|uniref:Uncharacterized protein n=1 Tax=uncultured Caudovirales phage TaxID=2100421 RepID=A0A6J5KPB2_9CAUD|nr:hypothetical protein UFOVP26_53 [uncultured Caudovirales phage]CAB4123733.1 hypothetical protein UFOVP44_44 [uncultured Caudovirales phage]CAB5219129.1 hypothetical protein UFOVP220_35 [uncultured Caudovirales phage]